MIERTIEVDGSSDFGPCDCCGNMSRTVWGYVHRGAATEAAYFVQWTMGAVDLHGANFDLIIGQWGEESASSDRQAVSLAFRRLESGPSFMVIDAGDRPVASSDIVGTCLRRDDVVGTPAAKQAFEIVDAIWLQDRRIAEIVG
jgi:hypothetical protein